VDIGVLSLESLWVPEHPLVPTRYPLSGDGPLPRSYTELPDGFATLVLGDTAARFYRLA